MPVPGEHNIYNALAAFCTGMSLNVTPQAAVTGLKNFKSSGMRQKIENYGGVTFIEDCYNASPDSMKAAFNVLKTVKKERAIAVLSDMLELGGESPAAHFDIGRAAAESGVNLLLCSGADVKNCCEGFNSIKNGGESCFFEDKKALADALVDILREGDTVLFKASRGMKLEETVQAVYEGWKNK
jgi:UDP-N-acetylmuramoyl-tripeptide--D-alanyl-D-alanine ligase